MIGRLRPVEFWLFAAFAAAGLGALVDRSPKAALAAVALFAIATLAAHVAWLPVAWLLAGAVVLSSALVDLPGKVHAGGFTANAGLTVAYSLLGVLVVAHWRPSTAREATKPLRPFVGLLIFALLSFQWGALSVAAIQNILVLFVFIVSVLCGIGIAVYEPVPGRFAAKVFGLGSIVAVALYAASLAVGGLGAGAVIGSRSFALFALLAIAWGSAGWRYRARLGRTLTLLSGLLILLSLSRIAFAAALVISCLAWLNHRSAGGWFRFITAVGVTIGLGYLAVQHIGPLHDRIYTGDVRPIGGGLSVNFMGRSDLWATTWHSYLTSPYLGHGVGTAETLITRVYSKAIDHPHNDYLRLLHDYGLLGACLWAIGYGWLLRRTWRSWNQPRPGIRKAQAADWNAERRVHAAAFLALIGVAIAMVTDNVIAYMYVMGPLGVLVGLSMGLETRLAGAGAALPIEHLPKHQRPIRLEDGATTYATRCRGGATQACADLAAACARRRGSHRAIVRCCGPSSWPTGTWGA